MEVTLSMTTLRPYQAEALEAVLTSSEKGIKRPMVVLPTGMGKTVLFTSIAREMNTRTLVIAHREELLTQAKSKFQNVWPGVPIGIVQGRKNEYGAKVVAASIQTLINEKRIKQLGDFGLIVVDECHHAAADSYMEVLGNLKAFEENGPVVLGVTATPNRSDGLGLDSTFQEIVYEKDILYGIENGYLCNLRGIVCRLDIDFKKLKTRAGDFQAGSSAELLLAAGAPKYTVEAYQEHANGRKGVVFTPTVEVAEQMADAFNKAGIPSAAISGKSKKEDRRNILKALDTGEIQMVANCGVLTEGFDQPDISCVIIARPTKSQGLYIQMVGRGTRLAPGKEDCIVIDMVGASDRNDLITMSSLYGTKTGETITEAKDRKEQEEKDETSKPIKSIEIDGKLVTKVKDLFKRSGFNWGEFDGKYHLQYGSGTIWIVPKPSEDEKWHVFNRRKVDGYTELLYVGLTLEESTKWGEEYIRSLGNSAFTLANKSAEWRKEPATQKQINFLRRNKIQFRPNLTKGQASRLIIEHKARGGVR